MPNLKSMFRSISRKKVEPVSTRNEPNTALNAFTFALGIVESTGALVPGLSPTAKGISLVIDALQRSSDNAEGLHDLADRITRLQPLVSRLQEHGTDLTHFLRKLYCLFQDLAAEITKAQSQGKLSRFINSKDNTISLARFYTTLDGIIQDATLALNTVIWDHFTNPSRRFEILKPIREAAFDSDVHEDARLCQGGTRVGVLDLIHKSIDSETTTLFWLHGPAGAGKTTIANTIAEHYGDAKTNLLGASFFFSRSRYGESRLLFRTIAFQLATIHSALRTQISVVLDKDQEVLSKKFEQQLDKLILDPVFKASSFLPRRLVVVIDALDECDDKVSVSHIIRALVQCLRRRNKNENDGRGETSKFSPLRFIVTSRPECRIFPLFNPIDDGDLVLEQFDLSDVAPADNNKDVRIFTERNLKQLTVSRPALRNGGWPAPPDIDFLVELSQGLFIASATSLRFLDSPRHSPKVRLETLRTMRQVPGLDGMYQQCVESAFAELETAEERELFKVVLGTVILLFAPVSIHSLASLMQRDMEADLMPILSTLRSVIHVPDESNPHNPSVQIYHLSFHDFLVDPKRCIDLRFYVGFAEHHSILAQFCLERMIALLRKPDICGLKKHSKKNTDPDVQKKVRSMDGDLVYACRYWAGHLSKAMLNGTLLKLLQTFVLDRLLYWVEVLCLIGNLDSGVNVLRMARTSLLSERDVPKILTDLLSDTIHFLVDFHNFLALSAVHTYVTALPLSPKESVLYKRYGLELKFARSATDYHEKEWEKHSDSLK